MLATATMTGHIMRLLLPLLFRFTLLTLLLTLGFLVLFHHNVVVCVLGRWDRLNIPSNLSLIFRNSRLAFGADLQRKRQKSAWEDIT